MPMMGMGGPPPMGPPMGGGMPPQMDEMAEDQTEDPGELLRSMLDHARSFLDSAKTEQDRLAMEKVTTLLQQILAQDEKDQQSALGMSPKLKALAGGY